MRERLEERLVELRAELAAGEQLMAELEARQVHLRSAMLRISGAIQVLEEVLEPDGPPRSPAPAEAAHALPARP